MEDKSLLEIVADRIKLDIRWINGFEHRGAVIGKEPGLLKEFWNPLDNSGDAFDLAIDLKIEFLHDSYQTDDGHLGCCAYGMNPDRSVFVSYASCGLDRCKATRRAIVMAAAEDY